MPLGADVAAASEEDVARVRAAYGLERPYVLWVGTLEPRKNLPRLLEAYARLDTDAELVLVGPRGWNQELDPPPGARLLGFVPATTSPPLYAGAAAFCFPSLLEGFGMPVVDAMAQGTPVVTSSGTSTEEIAGDAGLVVDPLDVDAIAGALDRVLRDPELAQRLGEAGRARAADLHLGAHGGAHRGGLCGGRRPVGEVGDAAGVRLPLEVAVPLQLRHEAAHVGDVRPEPAVVVRVVEEDVARRARGAGASAAQSARTAS